LILLLLLLLLLERSDAMRCQQCDVFNKLLGVSFHVVDYWMKLWWCTKKQPVT